jgi:hypothetical protein
LCYGHTMRQESATVCAIGEVWTPCGAEKKLPKENG